MTVEETENLRIKLEDAEQASKNYSELNKKLTDKLVRLELKLKSSSQSPHHALCPIIQPCPSSPKCSPSFTLPDTSSDIYQHNTKPAPAAIKATTNLSSTLSEALDLNLNLRLTSTPSPRASSFSSSTITPKSNTTKGSPSSYSPQTYYDSFNSGLGSAQITTPEC